MDSQFLSTARDCFNFVTKFFDPISVSATHIYHSALELCPTSSIVRKLYYDRYHGITRFPRVVIGTPDSWDPTISCSGRYLHGSFTWSPCGRFVAAQTTNGVEIRNQLTLELLTTLTKDGSQPVGSLAYSPDGRSIACCFVTAIVIWDIQTGGVAEVIERGLEGYIRSLVWSLDKKVVAITAVGRGGNAPGVATYDVGSGAQLFTKGFNLRVELHIWAWQKSFRLAVVVPPHGDTVSKITISEIESTLIDIESFPVEFPENSAISLSPSTYRISISISRTLRVLDIRNSDCLLKESGKFHSSQFSPDGSLFAASIRDGIRVWEYTSGSYAFWGEFLYPHLSTMPLTRTSQLLLPSNLQFSSNSPSILFRGLDVLRVWRLHDPPTNPKKCLEYIATSRSGRRIATAHQSESTITILDLHSQAPPQFIDTGVVIVGLVITGNVLLVEGSGKAVAWLLTEEGTVEGVLDNDRASPSDSIWTTPLIDSFPFQRLGIEGQVGVLKTGDTFPFTYHIVTGEVLGLARKPQDFSCHWISFSGSSNHQKFLHLPHRDPTLDDTFPKSNWKLSLIKFQTAGWVIDPEERHRFWVPVEWRNQWDGNSWQLYENIAVLVGFTGTRLVVIKL